MPALLRRSMASLALVALTSVLALLPTARATAQPPTVQYSFCLITGTNTSGVQNSNTYSTVSYGIMNTSTPLSQYTTQGTYVDWDFINAFMYTSTNPLPQPLTQQPANTVRGYVFPGVDYFNDNKFTVVAGTNVGGTTYDGLAVTSSYATFNLWNNVNVNCGSGTCGGGYGQLLLSLSNGPSGMYPVGPCVPKAAPSTPTTGGPGVVGDPQFVGLRGQSFQVHGVDGQVYNLIVDKDAGMRLNARFSFLTKGRCPATANPINCWSHPGSYLSEIGVWTAAGDRLVIVAGDYKTGFSSVTLNDAAVKAGAKAVQGKALRVVYTSAFSLQLTVGNFELVLENSDGFVNLVTVEVQQWSKLRSTHGLLGQTWRTSASKGLDVKEVEGRIDDYAEADNELLGGRFLYQ